MDAGEAEDGRKLVLQHPREAMAQRLANCKTSDSGRAKRDDSNHLYRPLVPLLRIGLVPLPKRPLYGHSLLHRGLGPILQVLHLHLQALHLLL